jgi:PKD repeat protein
MNRFMILVIAAFVISSTTAASITIFPSNEKQQTNKEEITNIESKIVEKSIFLQSMHLFNDEYEISGRVTYEESGIKDVLLYPDFFGNQSWYVRTNETGHYTISVPSGWNGTFRPYKKNYIVDPLTRSYMGVFQEYHNQNYTLSNVLYPPIWDVAVNTGTIHGIIVGLDANPRINDISLNAGDYIGGYYIGDDQQLKIGGADFWCGNHNIIFPLFGDDPGTAEKDGFSYSELINYKLFSFTTMKEYDVGVVSYDTSNHPSSNKWYPLGLSYIDDMQAIVDFDAYATATQNPICLGDSTQLQANIFVESTGDYTYSWTSEPSGFTSNLASPPPVQPSETTTYFLNVSDGIRYSTHQITIIVNTNPVVSAGDDAIICENMNHQLTGSAENYSELLWTTSGDGMFSNPSILNPFYTPGFQDKNNGEVILSLTAVPLSPCSLAATDSMTLSLSPLPSVDLGEDLLLCTTGPVILTAQVSNYSSLLWTTSGSGEFSDPTLPETQYFPSGNDLIHTSLTFTVTAQSVSPCMMPVSQSVTASFIDGPYVNAPSSRRICENQNLSIPAVAGSYSSLMWTTEGDGYFEDPSVIPGVYHPGAMDIANGGVTVTITAFGIGACATPASKDVYINIIRFAEVDAGEDMVMNSSDSYVQLSASTSNSTGVSWSSSGDGYFITSYMLNARYYPGDLDRDIGQFTLTLTVNSLSPCSTPISDSLVVSIINESLPEPPVLSAVLDHSTIIDQQYQYQMLLESFDPEQTVVFSLLQKPDGMIIDSCSGLISWSPNENDVGVHTVCVKACYDVYPQLCDTVSYLLSVDVENMDPVADFSYDPLSPEVDEIIQFTDSSTDSDGTVVGWSWDFGDGSFSTQQHPQHSYVSDGVYTVSLTVTDDEGATDTKVKQIVVVLPNEAPVADFSYTPESPLVDEIIQFTDSSMDPDGTVVGWSWVFGDGSSSILQHPTHVYSSEGTYMVSLTVTDDDGATDTITKEIIVEKDDSQSIVVQYHLSKGVNFISFDFLPDSLYLEDIFAPLTASNYLLMIIADNAIGGYYLPLWNINTLGNNGQVGLYRGYKVVMSEDVVFNVSGTPCTENIVLDVVVGANFVSFSNETVVLDVVGDLFDTGSLRMIVDLSNTQVPPVFLKKLFNNNFLGSLEIFQPGNIYLFIVDIAFCICINS